MARQTIILTVLGEPTLLDVDHIAHYWGVGDGGTIVTLAGPRRPDGGASLTTTLCAEESEDRVRELIDDARRA